MNETRKAPDWVCVTPQAAWQARDSQGDFVFDDHLWTLGGWFTPQVPNPRDVWKSPDGMAWTQVTDVAPWEHSDLSVALAFKGKMWLMGGRKLPGAENSNKVWSSEDGASWTLETDDPGWCPRVSASHVVFRDRMWVFGGTENFYEDNDQTLKNDVWSTADGKTWQCETENAAWPKRTNAQGFVFDDKIWIMGGGRWCPETVPMNDVWCSEDGVTWEQVTDAAPWAPRMWFAPAVYRDRMWVMGGWSRTNGNFGDVWCSKDGLNWNEVKSDIIWTNRHEHSSYVFKDKIWIAGGCGDVLSSEVWTLEIPEDWDGR